MAVKHDDREPLIGSHDIVSYLLRRPWDCAALTIIGALALGLLFKAAGMIG